VSALELVSRSELELGSELELESALCLGLELGTMPELYRLQ
jgi:hypothetical protein